MVTCPDCGKEVPNAKFCRNCGAKLPEVEEVEVVENDAVVDTTEEVIDVGVEEEKTADDSAKVIEVVEEETVEEPAEEVEVNTSSKQTKFCSNCGNEVSVETAFCPKCGYRLIQEEEPQTKFCQSCGKKININAEICPHCGVRVANIRSSEEKSVVLSAILSFLFPGLGHLYIGLTKKGISFIIAYIVSAILIMLLIGIILVIVVWLWALIDSIKSTEAINRGDYVEDKLF
ncbi:MAG: zinc-ribbon domain-containing protein [Methanobrevibacter thaueri]|jgi:uncharacterized membrane protein YvbJ|uniref:zinc ribbon domain-containing protein n=1 Tax=Methanobrevibacter thaueri TaxID=190975 RepID=UPI0026F0D0B5|nr:zinc ribbon domain-containing protein [Methanobrevibacter thaueri]MBE6496469.1 zinc-ribbon domain-containing protein [Methanobrevibacter thaueri]